MRIDYTKEGKLLFKIHDCINEILESLPEEMMGVSATPTRSHLFKRDHTNTEKLDEITANLVDHYTVQLIFLAKQARSDL